MANLNGLTTATTFIGIIELVLSILLFTQVGIDLLAPGSKEDTRPHFSVLGLHLANLEEWAAQQHGSWWFGVEVSLVVFSIVYAVASGLLVLGCIWRNRRLTVPWLVMSALSIVCQVISSLRQHTKPYSLNDWETTIAIWNIIVCVGIWSLVLKTQKRWARLRRNPGASTVTYSLDHEESSVTTPLLGSSEPTAVGSHQALGQQDAPLDKAQDKNLLDTDPASGSHQPLGQQDAPLDKAQDKNLLDTDPASGSHLPLGQQDVPLDKAQDATSLDSDPAVAGSRQPLGQQDATSDKVQDKNLLDTDPASGSHQPLGQQDVPLDKAQDMTSLDSDPAVAGSRQTLGQHDDALNKVQDTTLP